MQCICGLVVSAGEPNRRNPSKNPERAEPQNAISINAVLLPVMW